MNTTTNTCDVTYNYAQQQADCESKSHPDTSYVWNPLTHNCDATFIGDPNAEAKKECAERERSGWEFFWNDTGPVQFCDSVIYKPYWAELKRQEIHEYYRDSVTAGYKQSFTYYIEQIPPLPDIKDTTYCAPTARDDYVQTNPSENNLRKANKFVELCAEYDVLAADKAAVIGFRNTENNVRKK